MGSGCDTELIVEDVPYLVCTRGVGPTELVFRFHVSEYCDSDGVSTRVLNSSLLTCFSSMFTQDTM